MSLEHRCPVVLLCCGAFNPITLAHTQMFEIARNFLERTGNHIVISGVISPCHDLHPSSRGTSSTERIAMCETAVKKQLWLSVDPWESSQTGWVKTVKVLQQISNKIKSDYGIEELKPSRISSKAPRFPQSAVTLQPNGSLHHQVMQNRNRTQQSPSVISCSTHTNKPDDSLELNEASEPDSRGVVFDRLSNNFQKMCCAPPIAFNLQDNFIYGAAYDLRRTRVMLLCGGDFLESFGIPGLWSDDEISEIVSEYGIVCIPRNIASSSPNKGQCMRDALDRMQQIFHKVQGTVIIVNDARRAEIAHISSTKCRNAIQEKDFLQAESMLDPSVLSYVKKRCLYRSENQPCA